MATLCISPDSLKSWEKTGRPEFVKMCRALVSDGEGVWGMDPKNLRRALYELCWFVVRGQLRQEQCAATLMECADQIPSLASVVADTLQVIDTETSTNEDKVQRERLLSLIGTLVPLVSEAVLKERLDQETLEAVGLINSKQAFQQKYVKTKTKLYYKQQKFNLLREESEGYSKLITELNQEVPQRLSVQQVLENIKSLIGCFDLDPNRVLDIMLESFECRPEQENFYIPLFRSYMTDKLTLCHLLGFRFHFYEPSSGAETPQSLYNVAAFLLKHGLVVLDDLYPHLKPLDSDIKAFHEKELADAKAYARRLNVVILSERREEENNKDEMVKTDLRENNQKLGLCEALLQLGAWPNAKAILDRLPDFFATAHRPIATTLCRHIHEVIEPLYQRYAGLPSAVMRKRSKRTKRAEGDLAVTTFEQLYHKAFPMFSYLGPHASIDPILIAKFVRLGKTFMLKRQEGTVRSEDSIAFYGFLNILDEVVLPSLCLMPCNCCMSEELWTLLKLYPYELRYRLYGQWKNDNFASHAVLIRQRAECLERSKYIMKRLTKETVKPSGRQLGKLSHSNPGVMFEYVLSQIQRYDNFIGPVVDSLKYLTSMSYDVLTYCILEAVANPDRERLKHDDTNISQWLQSLANFTGSICRKYQVELSGLMQYVANQLKNGKSFDLLLLREVVQKMAGIEITEEITDDQLEAMNGGELLRQEGGYFAQVRNTKKSSTRLKDALLEHDLAVCLCLLMAQQRDGVIFAEGEERHLKLVGKLYDMCQDTLVQFGGFLSMQLSAEEFIKRLPPLDELISTYHLAHNSAFFLSRPLYTYNINAKFEELRKVDKSNKHTSSTQKTQRYVEACEEVMKPMVSVVKPLLPDRIWDDMSPNFYLTFWSLSMYDLCVPVGAYEKQIQQLNQAILAVDDNKDMAQSKKRKEKERCTSLIDKLRDEEKKQTDHVNRVMARLQNEKDQWFPTGSAKNETITHFLQLCVFPRCCFTASDAVFCAKFIHTLHNLMTPNFSTLICYDRIFCDITYSVTSCTENEAHRYGRFLCATLDTIMKWHSEKALYEKECADYPGFVTVFRKSTGSEPTNKTDRLDYENYRHVCHKWHFRLTKAVIACLESQNYIQIRNALVILTKILPHYPRIIQFGSALERRVDRLSKEEKDKRPDIYALAMGYSGLLKSKKSQWVPEHDFHIKEPKQQGRGPGTPHAANGTRGGGEPHPAQTASPHSADHRKGDLAKAREGQGETREEADGRKERPDAEAKKEKRDKTERKEGRTKSPPQGEKRSPDTEGKNGVPSSKHHTKDEKKDVPKEARPAGPDRGKERSEKDPKRPAQAAPEDRTSPKGGRGDERSAVVERPPSKPKAVVKEELGDKGQQHKERPGKEGKPSKREKEEAREQRRDEKRQKALEAEREQAAPPPEVDRTAMPAPAGGRESHRRSHEPSPHYGDERDTKRRKMESPVGSKSLSPDRDLERERKERKRDLTPGDMYPGEVEVKKRRSEERMSKSSKINGESELQGRKHRHSEELERDSSREREAREHHYSPNHMRGKREPVEEDPRGKTKKDKGSKKSKK